jgi:hypothetical protein
MHSNASRNSAYDTKTMEDRGRHDVRLLFEMKRLEKRKQKIH